MQKSWPLQKVTLATLRSIVKALSQGIAHIIFTLTLLSNFADMIPYFFAVEPTRLLLKEHEITQVFAQSSFVEDDLEQPSDFASTDNDSSGTDQEEIVKPNGFKTILANLQRLLRCLHDLRTSLEISNTRPEQDQQAFATVTLSDIQPYQYYSNCIRERFPTADDILVEAFGKANFQRYHYLQELQTTNSETKGSVLILGIEIQSLNLLGLRICIQSTEQ